MTFISLLCFGICAGIGLSVFMRNADPLSPARVFGFVWSLAIGLADFKFSAYQHEWTLVGWILLLTGIGSFLLGTFMVFVLNLDKERFPVHTLRLRLRDTSINESRLFALICLSVAVYVVSYVANYLLKGWLPFFVIGMNISRVDFNVSGLTLFLYSPPYIIFFVVLYCLFVSGNKMRKVILVMLSIVTVTSFLFLLQRYQVIMAAMMSFILLYYATSHIRLRTAVPFFVVVGGFFYWMSSLRLSHVVSTFLYSASKMKFSRDYAMLTEPYMYMVMNLENFARSASVSEYHTYGYFTFDFVTAITGLKYWVLEYFGFDRTPYLNSSYNTYTAFWWFYSDFGVIGLALISLSLGVGTSALYYRMRRTPTITAVTAYGIMVFVMLISYFNFPLALLWVQYNIIALFLILRLTLGTPVSPGQPGTGSQLVKVGG